jgi:hypothetical protein
MTDGWRTTMTLRYREPGPLAERLARIRRYQTNQ